MNKKIVTHIRHNDLIVHFCFEMYMSAIRNGDSMTWTDALESMVIQMAQRHEEMFKQKLNQAYKEIVPSDFDFHCRCDECGLVLWRSQCSLISAPQELYHVTKTYGDHYSKVCGPVRKMNV